MSLLLYAGRREEGKGWPVLLDAFAAAVARGADLDLVTMGVGEVVAPTEVAGRVHDLGFLPDGEAADAFAAAAAYVQPSRNESFSRTVMEAWLAGTPVLANAESAVVAWHCERSGAGITWTGTENSDHLAVAEGYVSITPLHICLKYTSPSQRDNMQSRMDS